MLRRILLLSAAALFVRTALCDTSAATGRWQATAIPWNRALPTVEVTLGYPGNYIPTRNSPIELKASAVTSPFDGYIGYQFVVGRSKTTDIPVASRARVVRGGTWYFTTTAQLGRTYWAGDNFTRGDKKNRELVVLWYDRSMHPIAQRNVGRPPWSDKRPLRIVRDPAATVLPQYLGQAPAVIALQDLGSSTQWYSGFAEVIAPLDLWLDLPLATRQKIFHSGVNLVTFGFPRADQHFTEIDRALIPVAFNRSPAEMQIPALYRTRAAKQLFPVSWRATEGSLPVGGEVSPYLVIGRIGVYSADETALNRPLPAAAVEPLSRSDWRAPQKTVVHDRLHIYWREFRAAYVFAIALLACFAVWLLMIRSHAAMAAALALIVAIAAITARASIRRPSGDSLVEWRESIAPNVIWHTIQHSSFGPSPLPPAAVPGEVAEWWNARIANVREDAEIRSSTTAPGHGAVVVASPWDTTSRFRERRELAAAPTLRVTSADDAKIVIDLDPRVPARYIKVLWRGKKHLLWGVRSLVSGQKQVTVQANDRLPGVPGVVRDWERGGSSPRTGIAQIMLVEERRRHDVVTSLIAPAEPLKSSSLIPFEISRSLNRDSDRAQSGTFVLPADEMPAETETVASMTLPPDVTLRGMKLTGPGGTIDLMAATRARSLVTHYAYAVDISQVRRIAGPRDVVRLDVETTAPVADEIFVHLTVRKKSS